MKLFRSLLTIVWILSSFLPRADEPGDGIAKCALNQPIPAEPQGLQGTWEGTLLGDKANQKIIITITGNALHFYRDTNFWFETTFTLPTGKNPKQLHATIKGCPPSQADSIGQVVKTFYKIEDRTFTLATLGDGEEETEKSFEKAGTRYELRKVSPQKKDAQPAKTR